MNRMNRHLSPALAASVLASLVALAAPEAHAAGIIKNPGDHPKYSVELEPHGLLAWDNYYFGDTGYGLGMHAVIPFLDNGPIDKINNNMGIGFGLDWAHYSTDNWFGYCGGGPLFYNCNANANALLFPIYVQWNFFLTDIISVFGEAGLGIEHDWFNIDYPGGCPFIGPRYVGYGCSNSHTGVFPYFEPGARFLFGDTVGLEVRIGWPLLTLGVAILI